jgi:CheY-like chemotaxis protein
MDGFALARQIKKIYPYANISILMLISVGRRGDGARCRKLGISGYLVKPIKQSDLLDAILTVFGKPPAKKTQSPLITCHSLRENRTHLHILLAEDKIVNQELTVVMLNRWGHTVVVAENGKETLSALENEQFDLVLMDVQMPEMDGFEATAAIREKEKKTGCHIPVIAITAHSMKGDRERCLRYFQAGRS